MKSARSWSRGLVLEVGGVYAVKDNEGVEAASSEGLLSRVIARLWGGAGRKETVRKVKGDGTGTRREGKRREGKGREGKGRERKGTGVRR
ncbi:hypothetical protein E2C01_093285 [Portunus trituberculatus]|uniref:Uncharacterized protein n=1 Tax=Portunus trituberculatus TaxID=210409 RepID=A0A5B7JT03_PORTR|nr:hypothetical protein [Portunus trituberculatus]